MEKFIGEILSKIRALRSKKGFTQEYMAKMLSIEISTYGKIENGKTGLSLERLVDIAKILEVSPRSLLTDGVSVISSIGEDMPDNSPVVKLKIEIPVNRTDIDIKELEEKLNSPEFLKLIKQKKEEK